MRRGIQPPLSCTAALKQAPPSQEKSKAYSRRTLSAARLGRAYRASGRSPIEPVMSCAAGPRLCRAEARLSSPSFISVHLRPRLSSPSFISVHLRPRLSSPSFISVHLRPRLSSPSFIPRVSACDYVRAGCPGVCRYVPCRLSGRAKTRGCTRTHKETWMRNYTQLHATEDGQRPLYVHTHTHTHTHTHNNRVQTIEYRRATTQKRVLRFSIVCRIHFFV